jgi:ribonuclease J
MNMMVLRTGDDIIVIDAGLMFPEQELLGVDIVIPDITYLKQNRSKIRAIVLTHAHEDHIGAIPYILPELKVPIYGTEFTLALVRKKLEEHAQLENAKLIEVKAGQTTQLGAFSIEYLHVTHSTIDCVALAVRTGGSDHSHRRLQDRPDSGRRQAVRPSRVREVRTGRRASAF